MNQDIPPPLPPPAPLFLWSQIQPTLNLPPAAPQIPPTPPPTPIPVPQPTMEFHDFPTDLKRRPRHG